MIQTTPNPQNPNFFGETTQSNKSNQYIVPDPVRLSETNEEIDRLMLSIDLLSKNLLQTTDKINMVLRSQDPEKEVTENEKPTTTTLGSLIRTASVKIEFLNRMIVSINSRIEL